MQWGTHVNLQNAGTDQAEWAYAIIESRDGGYISSGFGARSSGSVGPVLIKLDPNGEVVWQKEYDPIGNGKYGVLSDLSNPFNESTTLEVQVNEDLHSPELRIIDYTGKIVFRKLLHVGFNSLEISSEQLSSGIYFYSLFNEDKNIQTERMVRF